MRVWCARTPSPSGEAHSALVVDSGGAAGSVSFMRRCRTNLTVNR
ncbi:hypothetical protein SAMN05216505_11271 [Streptomyces prasinopilosus]|uniref:Uncharacterized protein n=1 Tax=Streptomyces prasinopilosus TaxID=67344 RepID=A0A1G6XVK8_9ACTN|nr:hypothetical protein SAMN05216505_11271 [Streptomyces prasinopilosus]